MIFAPFYFPAASPAAFFWLSLEKVLNFNQTKPRLPLRYITQQEYSAGIDNTRCSVYYFPEHSKLAVMYRLVIFDVFCRIIPNYC
jgi:hypothetical protein